MLSTSTDVLRLRSRVLQSIAETLYNAAMPRGTTLEALAGVAEDQWGLFTRRQAESTGMAWTTLARLADDNAAERVAHGVYRLRGTPPIDHLALRAAWMQLAPDTPVWRRTALQGLISHRSAASVYGLGHLPADVHHFILPTRRQSRRPDVRLHRARLTDSLESWSSGRNARVSFSSPLLEKELATHLLSELVGCVSIATTRGLRIRRPAND